MSNREERLQLRLQGEAAYTLGARAKSAAASVPAVPISASTSASASFRNRLVANVSSPALSAALAAAVGASAALPLHRSPSSRVSLDATSANKALPLTDGVELRQLAKAPSTVSAQATGKALLLENGELLALYARRERAREIERIEREKERLDRDNDENLIPASKKAPQVGH
jgi:hypothetical protein